MVVNGLKMARFQKSRINPITHDVSFLMTVPLGNAPGNRSCCFIVNFICLAGGEPASSLFEGTLVGEVVCSAHRWQTGGLTAAAVSMVGGITAGRGDIDKASN